VEARRGRGRPRAALLRGRGGGVEEEEGEGRQGLSCELQNLQRPRCKTKFSLCFKAQMRRWSK
jgi:hypothetical protein